MTQANYTYPPNVTVPADIMIDLETLGRGPGCAVLSIGAVAFDLKSGAIGQEFHTLVSTASCRALGLVEEVETVAWWSQQAPEARALLEQAAASDIMLGTALDRFAAFLRAHGGGPRVRVWGNGADFDNAIVADLYRRTGKDQPWRFSNSRCFRTYKSLAAGCEPVREGVHHDALDDARHQAVWACKIADKLSAAPAEAGEIDLYDDKVQAGIAWTMRQWGEALGLKTWTQGDGSESVEGDVGAEIHTILVDAELRDPETNEMAVLRAQPASGSLAEMAAALVQELTPDQGSRPCAALAKAVALQAALASRKPSAGAGEDERLKIGHAISTFHMLDMLQHSDPIIAIGAAMTLADNIIALREEAA